MAGIGTSSFSRPYVIFDYGIRVLTWRFAVWLGLAGTSVRGYAGYAVSRRSGIGLPRSSNTRRCSGVGTESFSRRLPAKLTVFLVRVVLADTENPHEGGVQGDFQCRPT